MALQTGPLLLATSFRASTTDHLQVKEGLLQAVAEMARPVGAAELGYAQGQVRGHQDLADLEPQERDNWEAVAAVADEEAHKVAVDEAKQ